MDATVIRDFEEELDKQGLYGSLNHNKTKRTYVYGDRMVEFFGADDEKKLRGAKRNILYCNEGNELAFKTQFFQLIIRTTDDVFIDFNPDDENVWINTELEQKRALEMQDVEVIVSTYKDNTFLPASLIKEIEYLEKTDPEFWKIYGLGQYGKVYGVIFENYNVINEIPKEAKYIATGMDFGFTNDPTAILQVYEQNGELYINELEYKRGLTNLDIGTRLKQLEVNEQNYIVADSAEPKSIQEIYNQRFNIHPAEKGKDSIKNSIDILKRYKLNITSKSSNLLKEIKTYKWATDKSGNSINEPVDYNNHCFTGETMITTINGQKRIDEVNELDYVLTSSGYKKVLKKFNNGLQLVNNYSMQYDTFNVSLCSTKEHKIKTLDKWIKISELQLGVQNFLYKPLTEKNIDYTQKRSIFQEGTSGYISLCGNLAMVKFKKVFMSTIKMATHGTTKLIILNWLKVKNIYKNTGRTGLKIIKNGLTISIQKGLRKQKNGTKAKMDYNGTQNTVRFRGIKEYRLIENATNVKKSTTHISQQEVNSVITTARLKHLEIGESRYELTYDLMVEDCHEYFANGILVHNCIDALRYVALNKLNKNNGGIYAIA